MIKTVTIESIRARKLARLWTALDAKRGGVIGASPEREYRYNARNMVPRPDIRNFGAGRFAAFGSLSRSA